MIKMGVAAFVAVFVVTSVISAVFITNRQNTSYAVRDYPDGESSALVSGFEIVKPIDELSEIADVVVRGVPISRVTNKRQIPARAHRPNAPLRFKYIDTVQFQVAEYLKGEGPDTISIFDKGAGAPDIGLPQFIDDQEYVLFLESTEGSSFWGSGHIVAGPAQGRWIVSEATPADEQNSLPPIIGDLWGDDTSIVQLRVEREFVHESNGQPLQMLLEDLKDEIGPVASVND